jgi:hypothetical protein
MTTAADAQSKVRTLEWEWLDSHSRRWWRPQLSVFMLSCGVQTLRWVDPPSKKSQQLSTVSKINIFRSYSELSRSKACTVLARSGAGIMGLNPTEGMDVWYVYVFILCLCCPVFR